METISYDAFSNVTESVSSDITESAEETVAEENVVEDAVAEVNTVEETTTEEIDLLADETSSTENDNAGEAIDFTSVDEAREDAVTSETLNLDEIMNDSADASAETEDDSNNGSSVM